jgi:hypothetical protein
VSNSINVIEAVEWREPAPGGGSQAQVFHLAVLKGPKRNPHEHLFQHVLVLPDTEESYSQAAALCWRWKDIQMFHSGDRELTAVLYERQGLGARGIDEASRLLKRQDIQVARLHDVPSIAEKLQGQGKLF